MNVGSLFSGIGGLDLGLERAGMTVRWQSEIDPYACRVLAKHWPHVPNLGDVRHVDWSQVEPVDLVCGGYPCQPFSLAGVRRGESDPRHLWPEFARCLRELRPRWALLENVPGHLSLGFGRVLGDLAELGFDAEWDCIPAAAVGAPHLRYRIFVVAHATSGVGPDESRSTTADYSQPLGRPWIDASRGSHERDTASGVGFDRGSTPTLAGDVPDAQRNGVRQQPIAQSGRSGAAVALNDGEDGDVADAIRSRLEVGQRQPRDDGTQRQAVERGRDQRNWWATEPDVGRVAHGVPHRVDRMRTLGNAVVPQVAEWIGHRIMEAAVEGTLRKPYPERPEWSPWTRFIESPFKRLSELVYAKDRKS